MAAVRLRRQLRSRAHAGRRAWRRLVRRGGAMFGLAVVVVLRADRAARAVDRAVRSARDELERGAQGAERGAPGSAPTSSAATCSRASSGARAPRCSPASCRSRSRSRSACRSAWLAGYLGGWVDALISRITDAMLACPFLILAIALAAFLGPSLTNAMIAIGISATPIFIRLTRGAGAGREGRGLRRGRARARQPAPAHRAAPHPAQHRARR